MQIVECSLLHRQAQGSLFLVKDSDPFLLGKNLAYLSFYILQIVLSLPLNYDAFHSLLRYLSNKHNKWEAFPNCLFWSTQFFPFQIKRMEPEGFWKSAIKESNY